MPHRPRHDGSRRVQTTKDQLCRASNVRHEEEPGVAQHVARREQMSELIPNPEPIVAVRDVLPTLGFCENWGVLTDNPPAFVFKCGNLTITATEVTSIAGRPQLLFGGQCVTPRTLYCIEFIMVTHVESIEQAIAWIVYGIGTDVVPSLPIDWFENGKRWKHLLPWERHWRACRERAEAHQQLRLARPHCLVAREWMRLLNKHLRIAAQNAGERDEFLAEFDGRMLRIELPNEVIGAPASGGAPWPFGCRGRVVDFAGLPKRLMTDPVEVGLWEGTLEVDRLAVDVAPEGVPCGVVAAVAPSLTNESLAGQCSAEIASDEAAKAADQKALDEKVKAHAEDPDDFQFGESDKEAASPTGGLFDQPAQDARAEKQVTPQLRPAAGAQAATEEEEFDAMFDAAIGDAFGDSEPAKDRSPLQTNAAPSPEGEPARATSKTVAAPDASAAVNTGMSMSEIAQGLNELFKPKPGTLGSGPSFEGKKTR